MTGADIIAVIILIGLAIAIAVYLLHWLYRRSSKEVSFVRSGLGGEKVVISGGAFVLPIIHNITTVGMRTLRIEVRRGGDKSLITKNRMRVELVAEFYVRVTPTEAAVSTAARSLGKRTLEPEGLRELVEGRFVDALGVVAAQMSMDEMQEHRGEYVKKVKSLVEGSISETGLELEAVALTGLDQAPLEAFDPSNAFDAEGLTQLTEQIELRKKKRNDIEQDTKVQIRNKNLETEKKALDIEKESEFSKLAQQRDIDKQRARERAEMTIERAIQEREAEEAQIRAEEEIEKSRISQKQAIEVERSLREHKLTLEVEERRRTRNDIEKDTEVQIQQKNLEAEIRHLEIEKENEYVRLQQQEEIAVRRAKQKADVVKEEAKRFKESEQAQIFAQEEVNKAKIEQQKNLDKARIASEEATMGREIEKQKKLKLEEQARNLAVIKKSLEVLAANAEEESARAIVADAEEKVTSARELEVAERNKAVELINAARTVEREAIQLTTLAKAEKEASADRELAEKHATLAAKLRYEVDAAGKQMLNEAENMRSEASRRSALRMHLAGNLESIIREAVKPMENIDAIKIMEVSGLPGFSDGNPQGIAGNGGGGNGNRDGDGPSGGSLADNVVNSALRYRAQMPFVDNLLQEIGMSPGEISNISNILGGYDKEITDVNPTSGSTAGSGARRVATKSKKSK
jgi:uncharacterized membrane protein YqiK